MSNKERIEKHWFKPKDILIPEIINQNSHWLAKKPALVFKDKVVNWETLGQRVNKVAHALQKLGLKPSETVVLLTKNSQEMLESILGTISANLVVVPLNISINDDAIVAMINNCDAKAIIASDEYVDRINNISDKISHKLKNKSIAINAKSPKWLQYEDVINQASSSRLNVDVSPSDDCNIIYSSGTTGLPKGIVHSHASRSAWAQSMSISLRYHSEARTLLTLGLYSNISWVAFLNTILVGGTMYVTDKFNPEECLSLIEKEKITHFAMVPIQFQKLLNHESFDNHDLSSIKATMCCGSPLTAKNKLEISKKLPGDFIELYGLTEGLVTILSPEEMKKNALSVGKPYPGQNLKIIGNNDLPVETGKSGEIVGISKILMSGYLNNKKANEEATWIDENNNKWFRTGDIGKLDEEGYLYLIDRKKDMIISGGQNIYPADIEAKLSTRKDVKEFAVIGIKSENWGETPLAIVVAQNGFKIDSDEMKKWLNSRLGKQQRVSAVEVTDVLPRNPAGKVLKRELRKSYSHIIV